MNVPLSNPPQPLLNRDDLLMVMYLLKKLETTLLYMKSPATPPIDPSAWSTPTAPLRDLSVQRTENSTHDTQFNTEVENQDEYSPIETLLKRVFNLSHILSDPVVPMVNQSELISKLAEDAKASARKRKLSHVDPDIEIREVRKLSHEDSDIEIGEVRQLRKGSINATSATSTYANVTSITETPSSSSPRIMREPPAARHEGTYTLFWECFRDNFDGETLDPHFKQTVLECFENRSGGSYKLPTRSTVYRWFDYAKRKYQNGR